MTRGRARCRGAALALAAALLALAGAAPAEAPRIRASLPDVIDPGDRYVFYSHGAIAEGSGGRPRHPRFGVYELPAIREALADPGWWLIAPLRPAGAPVDAAAGRLVRDVERLLAAGVPAGNIALVGFSKGGWITAIAAARLAERGIDAALLASCGAWLDARPKLALGGRLLSIHETSDAAGSCRTLATRSAGLAGFEEVAISTGLEHGAFYAPRPEWTLPLLRWLRKTPR